jgi:hypothetical protein
MDTVDRVAPDDEDEPDSAEKPRHPPLLARKPVLGRPPADPIERRAWITKFIEMAVGHPPPERPADES